MKSFIKYGFVLLGFIVLTGTVNAEQKKGVVIYFDTIFYEHYVFIDSNNDKIIDICIRLKDSTNDYTYPATVLRAYIKQGSIVVYDDTAVRKEIGKIPIIDNEDAIISIDGIDKAKLLSGIVK